MYFTENHVNKLIEQGRTYEQSQDWESAFTSYKEASELGSGEAAFAIAMLYLDKPFRQVEDMSAVMKKIASGMPVMPWDMVAKKVPDMKEAVHWLEVGAEKKNADSCLLLGIMLCTGEGCRKDIAKGVSYLETAAENGLEKARAALNLYKPSNNVIISDEEYESLLAEFEHSLTGDFEKQSALYAKLKNGTEKQRARLGYLLIKYKWLGAQLPYPLEVRDNGIPYFPVAPRRGSWETFIRIDFDAFPKGDVLLAFSTDIHTQPEDELNKLKYVGEAVYTSPSFGWLGVEKTAKLFRISPDCLMASDKLQSVIQRFHLQPPEYEGNTAFMIENGEKEYSVEIAAIYGDKIDVLYRYTIGGSDKVKVYMEPKLQRITVWDKPEK